MFSSNTAPSATTSSFVSFCPYFIALLGLTATTFSTSPNFLNIPDFIFEESIFVNASTKFGINNVPAKNKTINKFLYFLYLTNIITAIITTIAIITIFKIFAPVCGNILFIVELSLFINEACSFTVTIISAVIPSLSVTLITVVPTLTPLTFPFSSTTAIFSSRDSNFAPFLLTLITLVSPTTNSISFGETTKLSGTYIVTVCFSLPPISFSKYVQSSFVMNFTPSLSVPVITKSPELV